ncbi:hypothetical protein CYY_004173 [Polysphondylium violaceum]|uniref:Uncharacterized protein n=1 Tax=Polysphondylium violaceum TaxID=133409 RepID=A0A8J4UZI4_9MYCE|nr:hypothetical protein CYY_004173 [Polysphondylium violaceum]
MKIDEWFQQLLLIEIPQIENKWNKKKIEKKQLEQFVNRIESSILIAERLLKQYGVNNSNISKAWPAVFHARMLLTLETLNVKSQTYIKSLLSFYLKYSTKKEKLNNQNTSTTNNGSGNSLQHSTSGGSTSSNPYIVNSSIQIINNSNSNGDDQDNKVDEEKMLIKNIVEGMLEYLNTHKLDPDNSLIGFVAHQNLVDLFVQQQKYRKIRAVPSNPSFQFKPISLSTSLPSCTVSNLIDSNSKKVKSIQSISTTATLGSNLNLNLNNNNNNNSTSNNNNNENDKHELTVEYLMDMIQHWSKLKERDVSQEITDFLRSKDKLGIFKGDLVIIKAQNKEFIHQPKYVFARFTGQVCDSFLNSNSKRFSSSTNMEYLSVYINADENEWIWVPRDDVYKFSKDMIDNLSSSRRMATLIECPSLKLQKIISVKEEELLRSYLEKCSISPLLLDKLENQIVSFKDLRDLRTMGFCLSQLSINLPQDLLSSITRMVSAEVGRFLSSLDSNSLYPPTKKDLLENLDKYPVSRTGQLKNRASYLKVKCEATISKLISQKLEILDGTRKMKVVNWWLSLIKDQVDEYLCEKGYDPLAVPTDYTITPPTSMQKVANNLLVLHNVLPSAGNCELGLLHLVKKLKAEIYPVIQDFNQNIKYILCEWLDIEMEQSIDELDIKVEDYYVGLERNKSTLSNENVAKIKRMIKDVEYLSEMIKLESLISDCYIDDERRYDNEIIPISGLIYGRLFRIENELRTVLECWKDNGVAKVFTPPSNTIVLRNSGNLINSNNNNNNNSNTTTTTTTINNLHQSIQEIIVEQKPSPVSLVPKISIPEIIVNTVATPREHIAVNDAASSTTTSEEEQIESEISDISAHDISTASSASSIEEVEIEYDKPPIVESIYFEKKKNEIINSKNNSCETSTTYNTIGSSGINNSLLSKDSSSNTSSTTLSNSIVYGMDLPVSCSPSKNNTLKTKKSFWKRNTLVGFLKKKEV